jgi:CBS domain-containing protein
MKKIKSIRVSDYMARELVTFTPDMRVLDAVNILVKRRISGAPVVDDHGNLVGILSDIDCIKVALNAAYYNQAGGRVSEFMTPEVVTIDVEATIMDAAELILNKRLQRMPVVKRTHLVGQISRHDVLRAMDELQQ